MEQDAGSAIKTRSRTSVDDAVGLSKSSASATSEGVSSNKTRLIARNRNMHQSRGYFSVQRRSITKTLLLRDVFHVILRQSTGKLILGAFAAYITMWLIFAFWWLRVARPCGISLTSYRQALYLAIESMTTIGYGVDDPFFQDCDEVMPLLFIQSLLAMLLDTIIIGILFQRFARANARAATIIFSKTALLRQRGPRIQLAFRIAEMQDASLLQVSLQVYVLMHRQDLRADGPDDLETVIVKALPLQGLDDTNNVLLCGLPMTITHDIDRFSPLAPCNVPRLASSVTQAADPTISDVEEHLANLPHVEIIAVISGVEESTGVSVEGRQSYTFSDIDVGKEFGRCVYLDSAGKHYTDFGLFHKTQETNAGHNTNPGHDMYKVSI